jgi:uncharacterized protein YhhL (DUF1145 family)
MLIVINIVNPYGIEKNIIIQVEEMHQIIQHLNIVQINDQDGGYQQKMN